MEEFFFSRYGKATKQYAVIFYQGDEAFSGLLEFVEMTVDPVTMQKRFDRQLI